MSLDYQYAVIGAGAVGLAVAAELSRRGSVLVLEKCDNFGQGSSSRNSEVVHAGIYYAPGSLKARLCVEGRKMIEELVREQDIGYQRLGKYIVAVDESERAYLEKLKANAEACGVADLRWASVEELREQEPDVNAVAALFSPSTGIMDSHALMQHFKSEAQLRGTDIVFNAEVTSVSPLFTGGLGGVSSLPSALAGGMKGGYLLTISDTTITAEFVINSAGLYSDRIAALAGLKTRELGLNLTWSRGVYYGLSGDTKVQAKHLIYPVPDQTHASLGVHLCLDLNGGVRFGPTAEFMSEKNEDYRPPAGNIASVAGGIARYLPKINSAELEPIMVGYRAKLSGPGEPVRDFYIREESERGLPGFVNLIGIESPGLTASPAIARYVADLL